MTSEDTDHAARADELRRIHADKLASNPHHIPWVMCPECGLVVMLSPKVPEGRCARQHLVSNPHYVPSAPQTGAEDDESSMRERIMAETGPTFQAPNFGRAAWFAFLYLMVVVGAIAAGIYAFYR
ncbi:MAG: hypothetical protein ACFB9M_04010 [Myxococcota bacterium]